MDYKEQVATLAEQYLNGNVVTFFGAGASVSAGLPIAVHAVEGVLKGLCQHLPYYRSEAVATIESLSRANKLPRFETLIGRLVETCGDDTYQLLNVFESASPNVSHAIVATFLGSGTQHLHFTTNFDNLLEQASAHQLNSYYEPKAVAKVLPKSIYHLHGGCSSHHQDFSQIISTINGVLRPLPMPFNTLLTQTLDNYTLLFVGYSAEDDDIRPILQKYTSKGRIWTVDPHISPNSKMHGVVGAEDRIIKQPADEFFKDLAVSMGISVPSLDGSETTASTQSPDVTAILASLTASLHPEEAVSTLLLTLLDAGAYDLYEQIIETDAYNDVERFHRLTSLYEHTQRQSLRTRLQHFALPTDLRSFSLKQLLSLGSGYAKLADYKTAFALYEQAEQVATPDDFQAYYEAKLGMANLLLFYDEETTDKTRAITYLDDALRFVDDFPDRKAILLNTKGVALDRTNAPLAEAEACYMKALTAAKATRIPFEIAKVYVNLAELYRKDINTIIKTITYLRKARHLARHYHLENVMAHSFSGRLLAYDKLGNLARLKAEIRRTLRFLDTHQVPAQSRAGTLIDLCVGFMGLKDYDQAKDYAMQAIKVADVEMGGNIHRLSMAQANYLEVLIRQRDIGEIDAFLDQAKNTLSRAIDSNFANGASWLAASLAKSFVLKTDITHAEHYLNIMREQNNAVNAQEVTSEIARIEAQVAEMK